MKILVNLFYEPTANLKKLLISNKDVYFPINGGSSLHDDVWCAENVQMDDIGDNISNENSLLNEMTSIYWYWKNGKKQDYIGFNHYRRFFNFQDIFDYRDYSIIVSKPIWSSDKISLAQQYSYYHVAEDLKTCVDTIREEFDREWGNGFQRYLISSGTNLAPCNMFLMKYSLFDEWCSFVFPILFRLKEKICTSEEFRKRDNYQKRALCFLTERMFNYWYFLKKQSGIAVKEIDMIEYLDFKPKNINERGDFSVRLPKVALVALAKDEDRYLKEWVDYHLKIGFSEIFVYQNNWRYTNGDIDDPRVHLETIDEPHPQNLCYNRFIAENYSRYDFAAFFDIDEFFYIRSGESVEQFFSRYLDRDDIFVNWRLFGDSGLSSVVDGNYSVLKRFTKCSRNLHSLGKNVVNLKKTQGRVFFYNPHIMVTKNSDGRVVDFMPKDPTGTLVAKCGNIPNNLIEEPCELYHYRNKTWEELLKRRYRTSDVFFPDGTKSRNDLATIRKDFDNHNENEIENRNLVDVLP